MRESTRTGAAAALALSVIVMLGLAPAAEAGRVELVDGGQTVAYRGDSGPDAVVLSRYVRPEDGRSFYVVTEQGGIERGSGCFRVSSTTAACGVSDGLKRYAFAMRDGNDRLEITGETATGTADLGNGNDRFTGLATGTAAEVVRGGDGDDAISGGGGDDQVAGFGGDDAVDGGGGDDQLEAAGADMGAGAGEGDDDLRGGDGLDRLSYNDRAQGVTVSLDEQPGDGIEGERDNARGDVEWVVGTTLADRLAGDDGAQRLYGHGGADDVTGAGGNDLVNGGTGRDALYGGPGDDELEGSADGDRLDGGAGADLFRGDNPCAAEPCSGGADEILARDGERDEVICGVGPDTAVVDLIDAVETEGPDACESLDRPIGAAGGGSAAGGVAGAQLAAPPTLRVLGARRLRTLRRSGLRLEVRCAEPCRIASALLTHGKAKVAFTSRARLRGGTFRLTLELGPKGRKRVRRLARPTLRLAVRVLSADGDATDLRRSLRFRR